MGKHASKEGNPSGRRHTLNKANLFQTNKTELDILIDKQLFDTKSCVVVNEDIEITSLLPKGKVKFSFNGKALITKAFEFAITPNGGAIGAGKKETREDKNNASVTSSAST